MRMNHVLFMVSLLIIGLASRVSLGEEGKTATGDAFAVMKVLKKTPELKVVKKAGKDLIFPDAVQGSKSETVAPADNGAAQFDVTGEASRSYVVSFEAPTIVMTTGPGNTDDEKIAVTDFKTNLLNNQGGISSGEEGSFNVGATRADLTANQVVGSYSGKFTVRVTYLD